MDTNKEITKRLNIIKENTGSTQKGLANIIGTKRQTIGSYLKGTNNIPAIHVRKIAEHFRISADWILGIVDNPAIKTDNASKLYDIINVSRQTGLSTKAVKKLMDNKNKSDLTTVINTILENYK